jgi:hypothetical protein
LSCHTIDVNPLVLFTEIETEIVQKIVRRARFFWNKKVKMNYTEMELIRDSIDEKSEDRYFDLYNENNAFFNK